MSDRVLANTGLVGAVLAEHPYLVCWRFPWDDAYQAGLLGLVKADLRHDSNRQVKFSTYAWQAIYNTIVTERDRSLGLEHRQAKARGETLELPLSLDAPGSYEGPTLGESLPATTPALDADVCSKALLADVLADLPDRDRACLLNPLSASAEFGMSLETAKRQRSRVLARLRAIHNPTQSDQEAAA
jgi:hypothetical protein